MTEHVQVRLVDGTLDKLTTKLKTQGFNPETKADVLFLVCQQFLASPGAPLQSTGLGGSLLSPTVHSDKEEPSSSIAKESPNHQAGASENPLPFEAKANQHHNELENWQKASIDTSNSSNNTANDITVLPLTPKQEQQLMYAKKLFQLKVDAARAIEYEKQQTARAKRIRRPQIEVQPDQPFLKSPCPIGHTPSVCISKPCDNRGECRKEGRIGQIDRKCFGGADISYIQ